MGAEKIEMGKGRVGKIEVLVKGVGVGNEED